MLQRPVRASADEPLAVGRKCHAGHTGDVSHKALDELPRLEIPKAHGVVRVAHSDEGTVWGDGDRPRCGIDLGGPPEALRASEVARTVGLQGRYWEVFSKDSAKELVRA
jgi:hypothetical protein